MYSFKRNLKKKKKKKNLLQGYSCVLLTSLLIMV